MKYIILLTTTFIFMACNEQGQKSDAYGHFEATETIISAQANGELLKFDVTEGQWLDSGAVVGYIDTTQLHLKKLQLQASIAAVLSKRQNVSTQSKVYEEQKKNLLREKNRVEKLLKDGAATQKQMDDINGQLELVDRQMVAHLSTLRTANQGISSEVAPLRTQIRQIEDQIARSVIRNPLSGRVLLTYAQPNEISAFGKPLYKIADTRNMILRAYAVAQQLESLKIGQQVEVQVDAGPEGFRKVAGTLNWISEQAEFTPKTIQTKEERVNLVYAFKVQVPNDGYLKMGMPGEVNF